MTTANLVSLYFSDDQGTDKVLFQVKLDMVENPTLKEALRQFKDAQARFSLTLLTLHEDSKPKAAV